MHSKSTHGIGKCASCGHVCPIQVDADGEITPLRKSDCPRCRGKTFRRIVVGPSE